MGLVHENWIAKRNGVFEGGNLEASEEELSWSTILRMRRLRQVIKTMRVRAVVLATATIQIFSFDYLIITPHSFSSFCKESAFDSPPFN